MVTDLQQNLLAIRQRIADACKQVTRHPDEVSILAVTKTHPVTTLLEAASAGLVDVGENRVQEALLKLEQLRELQDAGKPPGAHPRIHLIGRLQSNKVNKAVGEFASIAAVDSPDLLARIGRRAGQLSLVQPIWIQVNVSQEPQKGGCPPGQAAALWEAALADRWLDPLGLMTLGRLGAPERETRGGFALLRTAAEALRQRDGTAAGLSMGMSDDFEWAILEGSTQVRLGTLLFGARGSAGG